MTTVLTWPVGPSSKVHFRLRIPPEKKRTKTAVSSSVEGHASCTERLPKSLSELFLTLGTQMPKRKKFSLKTFKHRGYGRAQWEKAFLAIVRTRLSSQNPWKKPGVMVGTCNPSYGRDGRWRQADRSLGLARQPAQPSE